MTLKEFFKSKTFRCILVLLCIALVSGALLSVMNDVLYVDNEERVARTIKKIYGEQIDYDNEGLESIDYKTENGCIDEAHHLADGNYLVKATGYHGYKEGSVTIWCVARFENGAFVGVDNVNVASYEKQTLMGMFTSSVLKGYGGTQPYGDIKEDPNGVVSGATYSSQAIRFAVNTVLGFVNDCLEVSQ